MMSEYEILNTVEPDLGFIHWLFEEAIAYQKRKNYPVWRGYDKEVLRRDIQFKQQYKIVINGEIACVFSVLDTDEPIWREKEVGNAIYLHRVVVNPQYKGQNQFQKILDWSIAHAKEKRRPLIRMDTWADNPNIISYYQTFGFNFLEFYMTSDDLGLPLQNRDLRLALLELAI